MKKELTLLRKKMKSYGISAYIIPTTDFHGSEYVNDYFKCRKFLSGFTGSAGTLVVTDDRAGLWTDGRYFLQAAEQLKSTGIDLMKSGEPNVPTITEYLRACLKPGDGLGFDGRVIDGNMGKTLEKVFKLNGIRLSYNNDLVGEIWTERPEIKPSEIYPLDIAITGKSSEDKLSDLRDKMSKANVQCHIMTKLEEIAWLFNLRGNDVENTPVFFSFALIEMTRATLYVLDNSLKMHWNQPNVEIKKYFDIFEDVKTLHGLSSVLIDEEVINYSLLKSLPEGVKIVSSQNPCEIMKAYKNQCEIENTRNAHIKDGIAMINFLYWLKTSIGSLPITEISASDYLERCRKEQIGCMDLSFPTISGYGPHGAIIHYNATNETNMALRPEGFLLVDSGGQFNDGTTDITRTIALGPLTDKMKICYTAVMKSHIALATAKFGRNTIGSQLDALARGPIQQLGLNYNHGTGHGVGHMLSVHEGPNNFSPSHGDFPISPGMITTDEPGVYLENEFGIRLENELLCVNSPDGGYAFEPLTYCPFDKEALIINNLSEDEKNWLNEYHENVYQSLKDFLGEDIRDWLRKETSEI